MGSPADNKIPDASPALRAYGSHAPRIARLLRHFPPLGASLLCAPRRAVHAVGAYLHVCDFPDDDAVVRELANTSPRFLLRAALPKAPLTLYRALDRCGDIVQSRAFYERLAEAASGPFARVLLAASKPLDETFLRYTEWLSRADEIVRHLPARLLSDMSATEAVVSLIALLRGHGGDVESALADLPSDSGSASVRRRLFKLLSSLTAPPAALPLPDGVTQVRSVGELREIGARLQLCVQKATFGGADYWMQMVDGRSLFVMLEEPTALAELRRVAPGVWLLVDVREDKNRVAPQSRRRTLCANLTAAGWKLVPVRPEHALMTLASRHDEDFDGLGRNLADALHELDSEWA